MSWTDVPPSSSSATAWGPRLKRMSLWKGIQGPNYNKNGEVLLLIQRDFQERLNWTAGMAQRFKVHTGPTKDPSLNPRTHFGRLTTVSTSSSRQGIQHLLHTSAGSCPCRHSDPRPPPQTPHNTWLKEIIKSLKVPTNKIKSSSTVHWGPWWLQRKAGQGSTWVV